MIRILFVDDDPHLVASLRAMLRRQRKVWHMDFAEGGPQALTMLEDQEFDVIVSDLRMPEIDGVRLLEAVRDKQPSCARIILTGTTELSATRRCMPLAHQVIAKPCPPEQLRGIVQSTIDTLSLLDSKDLKQAIGSAESLPPLPQTYRRFSEAIEQSRPTSELGTIVEEDPVLATKTLQLVNSAYFGLGTRVTDINRAIALLGLDLLHGLLLQIASCESLRHANRCRNFDADARRDASMQVAQFAASLLHDDRERRDARTLGLIHDIGSFVLAWKRPFVYSRVLQATIDTGRPQSLVEREVLHHSYAEVGAYLVGLWGIPFSLAHAIASQDRPSATEQQAFGAVGAVHVADVLLSERDGRPAHHPLDTAYLGHCGVLDELPRWRAMATEQAA